MIWDYFINRKKKIESLQKELVDKDAAIKGLMYTIEREVKTRQRYQILFDNLVGNIPIGLFTRDTSSLRIRQWNAAMSRMSGIDTGLVIGKTLEEILNDKEEVAKFLKGDDYVKKGENTYQWEGTVRLPTVKERYFKIIKTRITGPDSNPDLIFCLVLDLTHEREIQRKLKQSEARWRYALEGSSNGVWDRNLLTNEVYFSPGWKRLLGFTEYELPSTFETWKSRIHPDDVDHVLSTIDDYIQGRANQYRTEFRMRCKDNQWKWILGRGKIMEKTEDGQPKRFIGTHVDISELKKAQEELLSKERELKESESIFRSLAENTIFSLCILQNERIVYANPRFYEVTGYNAEEKIESIQFFNLFPPQERDKFRERLNDQLTASSCSAFEVEIIDIKGGKHIFHMFTTSIYYKNQPAILISAVDITEKTILESKLKQADKMQAIGRLAGGIAHDFNNQLMGILGYSSLLLDKIKDEKLMEYLGYVRLAASRSADLTQKLLAFSRKGNFVIIDCDIHDILREVISLAKPGMKKQINIYQEFTAEHSIVRGDNSGLQNAFLNLAINARDAMHHGGDLLFKTEEINISGEDRDAGTEGLQEGAYIKIQVKDTGIGIPSNLHSKIFEPFFTTKDIGDGTGLGLSATLGTIEAHKGAINVISHEGEGTCFSIFLPLSEEKTPQSLAPTEIKEIMGNQEHILIIDDEDIARGITSLILEELNYRVTAFETGEKALRFYKENAGDIDLVLLDMLMPDINGKELFRLIRDFDPHALIMIFSGYALDEETQSLLSVGAAGMVPKPINRKELSQRIAEVLLKKSMKA